MCDMCLRHPCDPNCPNSDSWTVVGKCDVCSYELCKGDMVYTDYNGGVYCSEGCAMKANGIREMEEDDWDSETW